MARQYPSSQGMFIYTLDVVGTLVQHNRLQHQQPGCSNSTRVCDQAAACADL